MTNEKPLWKHLTHSAVIVSALGYFVDIYDLVLFSIVRIASLRDLGVPEDQLFDQGVRLLNIQMAGLLIGGFLWGILGDKRGRLSVLFGSIFLYSAANLANAFVQTTDQYAVLRFIAGIGLAGELGAAITLVSECLPKEIRGYGTSLVAAIGVTGAALASYVGQSFDWRTAYVVGAVMGLCLLILRIKTSESGLFEKTRGESHVGRGQISLLFTNFARFKRFAYCVLVGVPIWYVVGILITFSPEICRALGATGPVSAGTGIFYNYLGLAVGDIASGLISQKLKSRKKAIAVFLLGVLILSGVFLMSRNATPEYFYALSFALGVAAGYWALFVTIGAEQFGINLRATVATTVPNLVRGSVIGLTLMFQFFKESLGWAESAGLVGVMVLTVAFFAVWAMPESFDRDLDFLE